MRIIYEIHVKNLYNNIRKEYKKLMTLEDLIKFNSIDPTTTIRRKEVAGNFLGWIVDDYFKRVYPKVSVKEYSNSDFANEINVLLEKFQSCKNKDLTKYKDVYKYSYQELNKDLANIEKKYGFIISGKAKQDLDYEIVKDDSNFTIYKILTPNGSIVLGKHTKWCISKDNQFILDIKEYIKQNYIIYFIKSKKEKNSAKNKDGELMFPRLPEFYGIILTPENEYLECVNSNNESLFWTSKYNKIVGIINNITI